MQTFRVIAYNAHLLPSLALPFAGERSDAGYRSGKIGENLASFDLIGLSEVFHKNSRNKLVNALQTTGEQTFHIVQGPARSGRHLTNSGLLLCSKFPIVATHTTTFKNASRLATHGMKSDGFAAKGALHARLLLNERSQTTLDCFLTHLESQSVEARTRQVAEFCAFVKEHQDPDTPAIVLGDFNISYQPSAGTDDSGYPELLGRLTELRNATVSDTGLHLTEGPPGSSDAMSEDGGSRIDYVFALNPESEDKASLKLSGAAHLAFQDERVPEGSLSDHLAVACEFSIRTGP
ncbi:MAG: endonuclease/exonuclease/phosphatase family protein [Planctomycetota bacterium]